MKMFQKAEILRVCLLVLMLLQTNSVSAQTDDPTLIIGGDDSPFKVNVIPPAPEAAALAKYADIPVSLYSGTPNVTIPLYGLRERDLVLPITLSYHASSHKVEDEASRVGLGWSLNAGGVITRSVRAVPDEYGPGALQGFLRQAAEVGDAGAYVLGTNAERHQWYDDMARGCRDAEPDIFYFNFAGYTGKFQFDWDGKIIIASGSKLSIKPIGLSPNDDKFIQSWEVKTPDGLRYIFSTTETSSTRKSILGVGDIDICGLLLADLRVPLSWYLTEIRSSKTKSSITFQYDDYIQKSQRWSIETRVHDRNLLPAKPAPNREKMTIITRGKYLRTIKTSSGETSIDFVPGSVRTDVEGDGSNDLHALGGVAVKNRNNKIIKNWEFGYDNSTSRLTLKSAREEIGGREERPYQFDYFPGTIPDPLSFRRDHWGFPNNNVAQTLVPSTVAVHPLGPRSLGGADRSPAPNKLKVGLLNKVTYPTGGSDSFVFEPHDYSFELNKQLIEEKINHIKLSGSAPRDNTPVNTEHIETRTFSLAKKSDLELRATFTYGTTFGGSIFGPEVRVEGISGNEIVQLRPGGVANSDGTPTVKRLEKTLFDLDAGQYKLIIKAKVPPPLLGRNAVSASLEWDEGTGEFATLRKQGGGVRVARIISDYGFGNPDKITQYRYTTHEDNEEVSSGSLLESGYVYEKWMTFVRSSGLVNIEEQKFARFSQNRSALGTTHGSHVGYSEVTALYGERGENGKTVYRFTSPIDVPDFPEFDVPFPPAPSNDHKRGLLTEQLDFSSDGTTLVREITNTYTSRRHIITGLKVGWAKPASGISITGPDFLDRYAWKGYQNILGYSRLVETREALIDASGRHEKRTVYEFDEDGHKQLSKETIDDSDDTEVVTQYKYPTDYPTGTNTALGLLVTNHRLDDAVETVRYKQSSGADVKVLSAIKNDYAVFEGQPRLARVNGALVGDSLTTNNPFQSVQGLYEPRLILHAYDDHGNILEHSEPNGLATSYVWDRNGTLPIAAVEHARANQIFYTSFEDSGDAIPSDAKTGAKSLAAAGGFFSLPVSARPQEAGDYVLSYWTRAGSQPWTRNETAISGYQPGNPITVGGLNGLLDEVRLYPAGARMQSFTYEPLVGRTATTDLNDLSMHYEFDELHRLTTVRDHDENILEHYEYQIGHRFRERRLNYVRSYVPRVTGLVSPDQVIAATPERAGQSTSYVDGKGRVIQNVVRQGSVLSRDLVEVVAYDQFGRRATEFLPFAIDDTDGEFKNLGSSNLPRPLREFYFATGDNVVNSFSPLARTRFEDNPLNRIAEQGAPGLLWQPLTDVQSHTLKYLYQANRAEDAILRWQPNGDELRAEDFYEPGSLIATLVEDEHQNSRWSFKDRLDRTIVELKEGDDGEILQTYFVYDDRGNLTHVIPPKAMQELPDGMPKVISAEEHAKEGYSYHFDRRNRLTEKRLPGSDSVFLVYDQWDRLVLTQSGEQRLANKWSYNKYDAFDRIVINGEITSSRSRAQIEQEMQDFYSSIGLKSDIRYESSGSFHGYTNKSYPVLDNDDDVNSVYYFDDYSFLSDFPDASKFFFTPELDLTSPLTTSNGMQTGTKTRILGSPDYTHTAAYYDDDYNAIQAVKANHNGSMSRISRNYTFSGKTTNELNTHEKKDVTTTILKEYIYDRDERLIDVHHKINDERNVLLYRNEYNELDQLVEKQLYSIDGGANFAQSVDYSYNIRGWPKFINDPELENDDDTNALSSDLFGMEIYYISEIDKIGNTAQFNGNVSAIRWKNAHFDEEQAYAFLYDAHDRLQEATYNNYSAEEKRNAFDVGDIRYDANGNIVDLRRNGWVAQEKTLIDNLQYAFDGNQLLRVVDATGRTEGFREGDATGEAFRYDTNGRMIVDLNKNIRLSYNYLDLPKRIENDAGAHIDYGYDAGGLKLFQSVFDGSGILEKRMDYVGDFVYLKETLQYIHHEEGVIVPNTAKPGWVYQYYLKDHLGNVRLTFAVDEDLTVPNIVQADDYYPFGLQMTANHHQSTSSNPTKHLYNGKELQDDLGLNWYDYGARMYDMALGRWHVEDAMAEKYFGQSPYSYVLNNPTRFIDPDGREALPLTVANYLGKDLSGTVTPLFSDGGDWNLILAKRTSGDVFFIASHASSKTSYYIETPEEVGTFWDQRNSVSSRRLSQIYPRNKAEIHSYLLFRSFEKGDKSEAVYHGLGMVNEQITAEHLILGLTGAAISAGAIVPRSRLPIAGSVRSNPSHTAPKPGGLEWKKVSRWMSPKEAMIWKGRSTVPQPRGKMTQVTSRGAPRPGAASNDVRVDFEVPTHALQPGGTSDWFNIFNQSRSVPIRDLTIVNGP